MPPALQTRADVTQCALDDGLDWKGVRGQRQRYETGGLGKMMVVDKWEVWLCDKQSPCKSADEVICYTYSEEFKVFMPWGRWRYRSPLHALRRGMIFATCYRP